MLYIKCNMKTATVRELRHQFNRVLNWIEHGEPVTITKRSHPIAVLTPAQKRSVYLKWPDFKARFPKETRIRKSVSEDSISETREERF